MCAALVSIDGLPSAYRHQNCCVVVVASFTFSIVQASGIHYDVITTTVGQQWNPQHKIIGVRARWSAQQVQVAAGQTEVSVLLPSSTALGGC